MSQFIFENYHFDSTSGQANFRYHFDDGRAFEEVIEFQPPVEDYDIAALDRALFLAFIIIGTSYVKTFPTANVVFECHRIDAIQAEFLNMVYSAGLSQFAFENQLSRQDLPLFTATSTDSPSPSVFTGNGRLVLQSGGKDSLLVASLLQAQDLEFIAWYLSSSVHHPTVLDEIGVPLVTAIRRIDTDSLDRATADGGKSGHVPVTYIVQSIAIIQAILLAKSEVLVSIAHEGEEPHALIGNLPVTHQWSKTWAAEQLFSDYVKSYISPNLHIGSPLRHMSELRVSELFVEHAWKKYGHKFSSCNRANYVQGLDNSKLAWCGDCPKCANSFILFAPYLDADILVGLFGGQDLFVKPSLQHIFKGLLGVENVMKPFECIGEIDELRHAYHLAQEKGGYRALTFDVPAALFDDKRVYPSQDWARLAT